MSVATGSSCAVGCTFTVVSAACGKVRVAEQDHCRLRQSRRAAQGCAQSPSMAGHDSRRHRQCCYRCSWRCR